MKGLEVCEAEEALELFLGFGGRPGRDSRNLGRVQLKTPLGNNVAQKGDRCNMEFIFLCLKEKSSSKAVSGQP